MHRRPTTVAVRWVWTVAGLQRVDVDGMLAPGAAHRGSARDSLRWRHLRDLRVWHPTRGRQGMIRGSDEARAAVRKAHRGRARTWTGPWVSLRQEHLRAVGCLR